MSIQQTVPQPSTPAGNLEQTAAAPAAGIPSEIVRQGAWLFRWRSYLPVLLLIPFAAVIEHMQWPWGDRDIHVVWEFVCLAISLLGLALRASVVGRVPPGTSGRNTKRQVAATLNTSGWYSIVRHPLYVGNFLIWLGIAMIPMNWWFILLFATVFSLYYERIAAAEENFLAQNFPQQFASWASRTPAFFPNPFRWQSSQRPFCWRTVLRREYTALGGIVVAFVAVEVAETLVIEHRLELDPFWISFAAFGIVSYLTLRTLKRHTSVLDRRD